MSQQIPFIGRKDELARIKEFVLIQDTPCVLCIDGQGGIGKTRLLQETNYLLCKDQADPRLLVTDIIDFDDHTLHTVHNFGLKIAEMFNKEAFEPYLRVLQRWRQMQMAEAGLEQLKPQELAVNQAFVDCFNDIPTHQRIVMFWDTMDPLAETEVLPYIVELIPQLNNTAVLMAGRNAEAIGRMLQDRLHQDALQIIYLPPLETQDSTIYLEQKQKILHITLSSDLAKKIILLAEGRPILIDLATEWIARNIPLHWLLDNSVASLNENIAQHRQDFEANLVRHFAQIRTPTDRLVLLMAHIYPLDSEMIAYLLKVSENDAIKLFTKVQSYIFVKRLPDGRITLHDEMRRLVNTYVWPEVDPDQNRQRRDSDLLVTYLEHKISAYTKRIEQIEKLTDAGQTKLDTFAKREALEREIWALKSQQLKHALFANLDNGVKLFVQFFDEATRAYRFLSRRVLLDEMGQNVGKLSLEQLYEYNTRLIRYINDEGQFSQGKELSTKFLLDDQILPEWRIDILIQRGNADIRLGGIDQAISDFYEAVRLSRDHDLQNWLERALNARGWAYRNRGDLDLALQDYLEAYLISLELNDQWRMASILNNMGYVHALKGNRELGLQNSIEALQIWQKINFKRGVGTTYSTLGEIYRRFNQFAEALDYYTKALDIFTEVNDVQWMSIVRSGRASVFWLQEKFDEAEQELAWALEHCTENFKPRIYHSQGLIHWSKNKLDSARQKFEECIEFSQKIGDEAHEYMSFIDLVELAWEFGEYQHWQEFKEKFNARYADRKGEVNLRMRGSFLRKIGDLAICDGNYEAALKAYTEGLPLIAEFEIHEPYLIHKQLDKIERRIRRCTTEDLLQKLGADLAKYWVSQENLVEKSPTTLGRFKQWERANKTV